MHKSTARMPWLRSAADDDGEVVFQVSALNAGGQMLPYAEKLLGGERADEIKIELQDVSGGLAAEQCWEEL